MKKIYLDHSATTPIDPQVRKKIHPYMTDFYGNASSMHAFGQDAIKGVDWAREQLANLFGSKFKEVIFTSGATESNNLALRGLLMSFRYANKDNWTKKFHIITSKIEHPAILEVCQALEKEGLIEATYVNVDSKGIVKFDEIKEAIKDNTILISVMYVNNEIGTIQPMRKIGELVEKVNKDRNPKNTFNKIYFHTDAVQAVNYLPMKADYLKADLITISGHKIYGPKGVGALYVREGTPIRSITFGGHQEYNIRPGTYNVPAIVGLGVAVELVNNQQPTTNNQIEKLRDKLIDGLTKKIPDTQINGSLDKRVAGNANISFLGAEGESILLMLDMDGIAVSTGSACASGSLEPSHVLRAMGIPPEDCHASIRFTLGKFTTAKEIDQVIKALPPIVKRLREMSPIKRK